MQGSLQHLVPHTNPQLFQTQKKMRLSTKKTHTGKQKPQPSNTLAIVSEINEAKELSSMKEAPKSREADRLMSIESNETPTANSGKSDAVHPGASLSSQTRNPSDIKRQKVADAKIKVQVLTSTSHSVENTDGDRPPDGKALPDAEKQAEEQERMNQVMIEKLIRGEKIGGIFARVKLENQPETESCVFRLADFKPEKFELKPREISQPQTSVAKRAFLDAHDKRNVRLNEKMRQVVRVAKRRLGKSDEGRVAFKKITENLHLEGVASSDSDDEWDFAKQLKLMNANLPHKKDAQSRIRRKLVKLGKIKHENELQHVDSLIESAYNSQKAIEWGKYKDEIEGPHASIDSEERYALFSDSQDSDDSSASSDIVAKIKKAGKLEITQKNNPLDQLKMAMLGFEPGFAIAGASEQVEKVMLKIAELNGMGLTVPETTVKVIYKKLCNEFMTPSIDVFKRINNEKTQMKFENYGLNETQTKPITLIMPYLQKIEKLIMKNCGLCDQAAALLIKASLGKQSQIHYIDLTGIEMGKAFIESLTQVLTKRPNCLKEIIMADLKPLVSIGYLLDALMLCKSLQYLDLNQNRFSHYSIESLSEFITQTEALEYLNLNACNLRGRVAEQVLDALMLNKTVQYLCLNNNRFTSSNNIVAAKLGRLIQGHPRLLHVDVSNNKLVREELIYIVLCVRDSKNVQGLHLTGNECTPYDRLLMRALLPCKVRWPFPPNFSPKFEKISGQDRVTLIMLNICFMTAIPPNYMAEIGLSQVNSVEEVFDKIKQFEQRKLFEGELIRKKTMEFQCTEANYKELIETRVKNMQKDSARALAASRLVIGGKRISERQIALRDAGAFEFDRYFHDPDQRIYDMFTMIDFYGRKKKCLELGHPLTKDDDKWYRDQRHRLLQQIQVLEDANPRSIPDYLEKMIALKHQVAQLNFLGPDPNNSAKKNDLKESDDSLVTEDLSEFDDFIFEPIDGAVKDLSAELTEQELARKLKKITKDAHDKKERQKMIERQLQDKNVVSRVKKIISLPPDHVPEVGAFANHMRGHKDQLIFTRVTGHPNYIDNSVWFDTNECWVCGRHSKMTIAASLADSLKDQEFEQIILLTSMMTKRTEREQATLRHDKGYLETLLEEKSPNFGDNSRRKQGNLSDTESNSSGSGADIDENCDPAYINQTKQHRKLRLFHGVHDQQVKLGALLLSQDRFESDEDDGSVAENEGESTNANQKEKYNRTNHLMSKNDQARSLNFSMYHESKNVLQMGPKFSKKIVITQNPDSNLTLFNPMMAARPIQLKNVLSTVYKDYMGPSGPDRFNQVNHKYHVYNGVLYRNLNKNTNINDSLSRQAGRNRAIAAGGTPDRSRLGKKTDSSAPGTAREPAVDLTSEELIVKTERMITKFEIQDSVLSRKIQEIQDKESKHHNSKSARATQTSTAASNTMLHLKSENAKSVSGTAESEAQRLWLIKHGVGPNGEMPPLRIKSSGREFVTENFTGAPKTATGAVRPRRRNISVAISSSLPNDGIARRQAQTSHGAARGKTSAPLGVTCGKESEPRLASLEQPEPQLIERGSHVAYNPKVRPKTIEDENFKQFWAIFNQKEESNAIYIVSSVNNWMPIKLADSEQFAKDNKALNNATTTSLASRQLSQGDRTPVSSERSHNQKTSTMKLKTLVLKESDVKEQQSQLENIGTPEILQTNETASSPVPKDLEEEYDNHTNLKWLAGVAGGPPRIDSLVNPKNGEESHRRYFLSKHQTKEHCRGHQGDVNCQVRRVEHIESSAEQYRQSKRQRLHLKRTIRPKAEVVEIDSQKKTFEVNLFCRPGRHHFFFVRQGKHFMLSYKYPTEKYKETNVRMNYIDLPERDWKIGKPMIDRDIEWALLCDQSQIGEQNFDKNKSVFKNYKLDTPQLLEKMFENDLRLTKIPVKIKDKDQFAKVKAELFEHYAYIKNMFLVLSCDSTYHALNKQDFDVWALNCKFQDRPGVDEPKINLQREGALQKNELVRKIADGMTKNDMLRFQFLEVIFRLAELCYQGEIKQTNDQQASRGKKKKGGKIFLFQAISRLFKEHIEPAGCVIADTQQFRDEHLYNYRVNQYFERNEPVFKKIHSEYNYAGKFQMSPLDAVNFVTITGNLSYIKERFVMRLYGFSKMSNIDYQKTPTQPKELIFVEFLEFFARLAFWAFELDESEKYAHFELHERMDALLAHFCKRMRLQRNFAVLKEEQSGIIEEIIEYMNQLEQNRFLKLENSKIGLSESGASASGIEASDSAAQFLNGKSPATVIKKTQPRSQSPTFQVGKTAIVASTSLQMPESQLCKTPLREGHKEQQ